jgi:hypothetical protein
MYAFLIIGLKQAMSKTMLRLRTSDDRFDLGDRASLFTKALS